MSLDFQIHYCSVLEIFFSHVAELAGQEAHWDPAACITMPYMNVGGLNTGSHAHTQVLLPIEPSPKSLTKYIF